MTVAKVEINGDALRAEIFRKNLSLQAASRKIGFSQTYFSTVLHAGEIPETKLPLIENVLGIRPDKYVVKEEQIEMETPKPEQKTEPTVGGKMVRNIDVEFIRFRAHELGLPLKSFCDVMGKRDNYLYNLRTNGATRDDYDRMKLVLRLDADDNRLIRKTQPVETAPAETVEDIQTKLHKHEAKIAALQTEINKLKAQIMNNKPM